MTAPEQTAQRELALTLLARRTGPGAGADAIAAAAGRAYDDLVQVLTPVIGDVGVAAITDRALHLATRHYAWLPSSAPGAADTSFTKVIDALKRYDDPAVAAEAAAAVLAAILALLATFIGEPLAARLVRQAWPDAPSSAATEET
jgi:hypothetical protein